MWASGVREGEGAEAVWRAVRVGSVGVGDGVWGLLGVEGVEFPPSASATATDWDTRTGEWIGVWRALRGERSTALWLW